MAILALETSSTRRGVALFVAGRVVAAQTSEGSGPTPLFGMIREVLEKAGVQRGEIRRVAVGLGPGSYTGVRVALSVAQGWQAAREVSVVGITSFEVMAATRARLGDRGELWLVVDAQRGDVYAQRFQLTEVGAVATGEIRLGPYRDGVVPPGARVAGPPPERQGNPGLDWPWVYPEATDLALLASKSRMDARAERLEPVYLRETQFVKAPPAREL